MKKLKSIIKNLMNKEELPHYTRPNMNNLRGRHGRAIINEIRSMEAPQMDDVRQEADKSMQRIYRQRNARISILGEEKEQAQIRRKKLDRKFFEAIRDVERSPMQISDDVISKGDIEYLRYKLHIISDSYADFEIEALSYAASNNTRLRKTICYLVNHPEAKSSDVLEYISNQRTME